MTGRFEVFVDGESNFRFRLTAPDGTVVAESAAFADKTAAVAGIATVRECAGMGLVAGLCTDAAIPGPKQPSDSAQPAVSPQARHDWRKLVDGHRAGTARRAPARRWSGAA